MVPSANARPGERNPDATTTMPAKKNSLDRISSCKLSQIETCVQAEVLMADRELVSAIGFLIPDRNSSLDVPASFGTNSDLALNQYRRRGHWLLFKENKLSRCG